MDLTALDKRHLWHPFTQQTAWEADTPLLITSGEGNYLIAADGNRYLDGVSSLWVSVHGHRCAEIDEAIRDQLEKIAHCTLLGLANPPSIELAARLAELAPGRLSRVFYSDSGSTAVEVALKMAFQYWQLRGTHRKQRFVSLENAYHGDTLGAVSVGGIGLFFDIFHPLLFRADHIPAPRSLFVNGTDELPPAAQAEKALGALERLLAAEAEEIAALIIEPRVQGAAGMLVAEKGFLGRVAELCRAHEVLLIADEVATGFGRTGPLFACQTEGVEPDLMALAKGITGGYLPLAATLATEEIYEAFCGERGQTFFHGHTYTGNALACRAAIASIDRLQRIDLLAHAQRSAQLLGDALESDIVPLRHVGEVRRLGLMVGIELVEDRAARRAYPAGAQIAGRVCRAIRRHGVILRQLGDVVIMMPPLAIRPEEVAMLVAAAQQAIIEVTEKKG